MTWAQQIGAYTLVSKYKSHDHSTSGNRPLEYRNANALYSTKRETQQVTLCCVILLFRVNMLFWQTTKRWKNDIYINVTWSIGILKRQRREKVIQALAVKHKHHSRLEERQKIIINWKHWFVIVWCGCWCLKTNPTLGPRKFLTHPEAIFLNR